MSDNERIIENINATMSMEDMPLMDVDKDRIRKCLEGKLSFQTEVELLIKKYVRKKVV